MMEFENNNADDSNYTTESEKTVENEQPDGNLYQYL